MIIGTTYKKNVTDFKMLCGKCGREFYADSRRTGEVIMCPHCGHRL